MKFHTLLPVRDEADIIAQCLQHLLTWTDSIYVFDTGSVDDTWEIVQDFASKDKRIIPIKKEPVYFSDTKLRGYIFNVARQKMNDGDWFLRTEYPTDEQRWSQITNTLGMPTLLEIPNSDGTKQKLFNVLNKGMSGYKSFAVALMERGITSGNKESARYFYEQIVSRRIFFERRLYQKAAVIFYRLLFKVSPQLGIKLLKTRNYDNFAQKIATEDPTRRM